MGSDKTWRNCELVLYPESMDNAQFEVGLQITTQYAWILHKYDKKADGTPKKEHIHCYCKFKTPKNTSTICKAFGINENQIERIKGTWADALDYLTHHNAPEKYQYDVTEVHSNFDWQKEAEKATNNKKLDVIIEKIGLGEIRAYNLTEYVTASEYVKWRRQIDNAFKWRASYVKAHLEELVEMKDVVWIYGTTGTGKTSLAKKLAKKQNLIYAITSIGRNPFDEYEDEPCLIIDDLRPDDLRFSDLLGILDPYNFKAAQARYQNKALQTQLVIVTTTMDPDEFWYNMEDASSEDKKQLFRRLNTIICMTQDEMIEMEYDDALTNLHIVNRYPNVVLAEVKKTKGRSKVSMGLGQLAARLYFADAEINGTELKKNEDGEISITVAALVEAGYLSDAGDVEYEITYEETSEGSDRYDVVVSAPETTT